MTDRGEAARTGRSDFIVIGGLALTIRLLYLYFVSRFDPFYAVSPPHFDMHVYTSWGLSIAQGDWLSSQYTNGGPFFYGPVYPYFLGLLFLLFGENYHIVHIVQALLGSAVPVLVYDVSRRLFGRREAIAAGILAAVAAPVLFYEQILLMEGLLLFLHALVLWLFVTTHNSERPWPILLFAGICAGLATLARSNFLLLLPCFAILAWTSGKRTKGRRGGLLAAGAFVIPIIVILAVSLTRNLLVAGTPTLTTSNGPMNLYIGNAHDATGVLDLPESFIEQVKIHGSQENVPWKEALRQDMGKYPAAVFRLYLRKCWLLINSHEPADNVSFDLYKEFLPLLKDNPVDWLVVFPLGLAGALITRKRVVVQWPLYLYALGFPLTLALVFILGRYRLPMFLPFFCWSGVTLVFLWDSARATSWSRLSSVVSFCLIVGAATLPNWSPIVREQRNPVTNRTHTIRKNDYVNLSQGLIDRGRNSEAVAVIEKGILHYPFSPELISKLCSLRLATGDGRKNIPLLEDFIRRKGNAPAALDLLARSLEQAGDQERAKEIRQQLSRMR